ITFGASESLDQLNVALAANNLSASLDSANKLVITTTNDAASSTIGVVAYPGAGTGTLTFGAVAAPVADAASQIIRANLVSQYNNVITQITTTAQDSSFNGINLLNGDDLKLTFNETGRSTLNIKGVTFNAAGLWPCCVDGRNRLPGQRFGKQGSCPAWCRQQRAADPGVDLGFEPLDRADPSGLLQEPDQRSADRFVQPDAGRHQRGSGEQPGAVDPPVDRGVRAGAGQPVAAERAPVAPLTPEGDTNIRAAGETPPPST